MEPTWHPLDDYRRNTTGYWLLPSGQRVYVARICNACNTTEACYGVAGQWYCTPCHEKLNLTP